MSDALFFQPVVKCGFHVLPSAISLHMLHLESGLSLPLVDNTRESVRYARFVLDDDNVQECCRYVSERDSESIPVNVFWEGAHDVRHDDFKKSMLSLRPSQLPPASALASQTVLTNKRRLGKSCWYA